MVKKIYMALLLGLLSGIQMQGAATGEPRGQKRTRGQAEVARLDVLDQLQEELITEQEKNSRLEFEHADMRGGLSILQSRLHRQVKENDLLNQRLRELESENSLQRSMLHALRVKTSTFDKATQTNFLPDVADVMVEHGAAKADDLDVEPEEARVFKDAFDNKIQWNKRMKEISQGYIDRIVKEKIDSIEEYSARRSALCLGFKEKLLNDLFSNSFRGYNVHGTNHRGWKNCYEIIIKNLFEELRVDENLQRNTKLISTVMVDMRNVCSYIISIGVKNRDLRHILHAQHSRFTENSNRYSLQQFSLIYQKLQDLCFASVGNEINYFNNEKYKIGVAFPKYVDEDLVRTTIVEDDDSDVDIVGI